MKTSKSFAFKKTCAFAAGAFAMVGALTASNVFAAAASDSATTSATVVTPIDITVAQNLTFGEFAAGTGGTVVLTTGGAASVTGDVLLTAGTPAAAQFTVTGEADETYSISIVDDDLTHTDTTTVMALAITHDVDGSSEDDPAVGTLTLGTDTIYVGGTLTVGSGQLVGVYSGTITATVNYN
jgi:hypothetical protein